MWKTSVPYLRTENLSLFIIIAQLSANEIQGNTVSFRLLAEQEQSNFIIKVLEIQEGKVPSEKSVLRGSLRETSVKTEEGTVGFS